MTQSIHPRRPMEAYYLMVQLRDGSVKSSMGSPFHSYNGMRYQVKSIKRAIGNGLPLAKPAYVIRVLREGW